MIRTANIEVSLQRLSILRIEHPQANPLKLACTFRAGETLPSGLTVTAEIHTSRNVQSETTPLASSTVTVGAGAVTFDVSFTSAQLNQTVTPDGTRALWLVVYGVGDADQLYTLAAADLLLGWHAISQVTAPPPAVSLSVEKGGVAWVVGRDYDSGTIVTVGITAYVCTTTHTSAVGDEPGEGMEWESFWVVLSGGGGGGSVTLTGDVTGSGTGTVATTIADNAVTTAKILNGAVTVAKTSGFGTIATQAENNVAITGGSITGITDLAIADGGTGASNAVAALSNLGAYPASNPSGFTTNTGTVTTVSVSAANGVSGTVANATTTPAITLTLGAITPSSVNGITFTNGGSGALTVTGTASVSGTNTGDVTIAGQNYLTIAGQVITAAQVNLASHVTGDLPLANLAQASGASVLLGRGSAGGAGDFQQITVGSGLSMTGTTLSATATGGGTNTILQFFPRDAEFPATNFATIDTRNNHPCLDFDASTTETVFFTGIIPQGASFAASGSALTFRILSTAESALTGNIGWLVALERIVANGIDIDFDDFGTAQSGSAAVIGGGNTGKVSEVTVAFTLAQLPSGLAAGDQIRVRVQRNTAVSGNHSGDAELLCVFANMTPLV